MRRAGAQRRAAGGGGSAADALLTRQDWPPGAPAATKELKWQGTH